MIYLYLLSFHLVGIQGKSWLLHGGFSGFEGHHQLFKNQMSVIHMLYVICMLCVCCNCLKLNVL